MALGFYWINYGYRLTVVIFSRTYNRFDNDRADQTDNPKITTNQVTDNLNIRLTT
jgi:hypothetical protein